MMHSQVYFLFLDLAFIYVVSNVPKYIQFCTFIMYFTCLAWISIEELRNAASCSRNLFTKTWPLNPWIYDFCKLIFSYKSSVFCPIFPSKSRMWSLNLPLIFHICKTLHSSST